MEDDYYSRETSADEREFQSTSPVWRTTKIHFCERRSWVYFNPRPPCGGRRYTTELDQPQEIISIHVPRVEDDSGRRSQTPTAEKFQSTSPVWRTTDSLDKGLFCFCDFNPRPPCGGRPISRLFQGYQVRISIHVPRVEDDVASRICRRLPTEFQSTSPVWRTTAVTRMWCSSTGNFNPRPPCGGRRTRVIKPPRRSAFQSTSPVWRTTRFCGPQSDNASHFNPRPPCGGRPTTERKK